MGERPLLEVCVDSPAGLAAAIAAGADRIELCAALGLAGLTPSPGMMALAARQARPSYAMIRPRPGDFVFGPLDVEAMRGDIDAARAAGLPGVVLGASRPDGALDEDLLQRLAEHAAGLGLTLHRAFDLVPEGAARLADLAAQAGGRIAVMAGAGVTVANVADLIRRTGVREVHGSCGAPVPAGAEGDKARTLGFVSAGLRDTSAEAVEAMARALAMAYGERP
jgi:copper homeostasis protein